nr:MMPL family transporter [Aliiroseovarius subalbicans]
MNLARLMSADRRMMLAILPIPEVAEDMITRARTLEALENLTRAHAKDGVTITLSGYPVLRERMVAGLLRDIVFLNLVGTIVGFVVATLTLRSFTLGALTVAAPATSLFWVLGMLGHLGISINVITITLPVLVLVLATSDALHISIDIAKQGRDDPARSTLRAVRRIAPGCILAAITTACAFGALTLSRSAMISDLGLAGALSTTLSVLAVLVTQTLVFTSAGRRFSFDRLFAGKRGTPAHLLSLRALPRLSARAPRVTIALALTTLVATTGLFLTAEPRYSLYNNLDADDPVLSSLRRAEAKLAPVSALQVPFEVVDETTIAIVHDAVSRHVDPSRVLSLHSLDAGADSLDSLPPALTRRMISADGDRAVVSVLFDYVDAAATRRDTDALNAALADDPALADLTVAPTTGLSVMSSYVSEAVLRELNLSFAVAILASGLLIGLWLRVPRLAFLALVPNVLPVTIIGAGLVLTGKGLEFSSGLALTVTFGLAVDDTVHVLNRLRLNGALHDPTPSAVARALHEVAPALVVTSIVLTFGMLGTFLAETPTVIDFGALSISVFVLALVADLMVLPALLSVLGGRSKPRRGLP